ncbi:hypothetical protein TNCV_1267891 [Trichonephila clavipes]|nr:hypothetical protein TNCV_1267891 [Trichonephila clavipes]
MFAERVARWKEWSGILVFQPVSFSNMLWSSTQRTFAVEAYFSKGRLFIAVQFAFHRHFGIPPRGRVSDVLMWMELSKQRGMSPSKEKDLRRPLKHLKMWYDFGCQFRQCVIMIQQLFLNTLKERNHDNVVAT